jgi:hypothetical protein
MTRLPSMASMRTRVGGALLLRLATVAGLVVDAVIHLQLAPVYQLAAPGGIGQGNLFRVEAVLALVTALFLLVRPSRITYAAAFAVAAGGLAAVLLYRYVDVPAVGPIPAMYEPLWFAKKTVTAVAEAVATVTALIGLLSRTQSAPSR